MMRSMSEDEMLLAAILNAPDDETVRLVYADWLEEQGDVRGEYLRLLCDLRAGRPPHDHLGVLQARLEELEVGLDPLWVALMRRDRASKPGTHLAEPSAGPSGERTCLRPDCRHLSPPASRYCGKCTYPLPLQAGTEIAGRYRIDRLLHLDLGYSSGYSFGPIYLAADLAKGQFPVAVREFASPDPTGFQLGLPVFRAAYDKLHVLQTSPLVPEVYDFLEGPNAAYITTEYLPGPSLAELIGAYDYDSPAKPFPVPWVVELGKRLCDFLAFMHSQQPPLLRGGVKPEDLLLDNAGKVKVVNFGLARQTGIPGTSPLYWPWLNPKTR
jgi:uncharacterized protein (TIGR02996 family)